MPEPGRQARLRTLAMKLLDVQLGQDLEASI